MKLRTGRSTARSSGAAFMVQIIAQAGGSYNRWCTSWRVRVWSGVSGNAIRRHVDVPRSARALDNQVVHHLPEAIALAYGREVCWSSHPC